MRILFFILTSIVFSATKIIIEDANIAAISHDDIGMIFYVALHNTDNCGYHIYTRMVKCIEEVEINDKECEMMQLLGGDMGEIRPQCYKNITLLYPNMYLYNRKGYCIIAIKFISEDNQVLEKKTNVTFNTYLGNKNGFRSRALENYAGKLSYTQCDSVDLDPFQNCAPVDCHMKYLGTRSYFNKKWRRCQKVPVCVFDIEKELPDVGYTPITNKCIDLERCIKKSDLQPLDNKYAELTDASDYSSMTAAINCHFGKFSNQTGLCDCYPGWTSAPFDKEPTLFPIHMCNIELSSWYDSNRSEITFVAFIISVVAVAVAVVVVLISFILYHIYKCLKNMETPKTTCYCDLETGMEDDKKSKKKKKEKEKPAQPTPSTESKTSKGSDKKSTKSKESLKSGSVDNKETQSEADAGSTGKPKKKSSKTKTPEEQASKTSVHSEDSKKENKKKKSKTEVQPVVSSGSAPSKKSSKSQAKPSTSGATFGKKGKK